VGASITLTAEPVGVEPGGETSLAFRLRNTGTVVDEFNLSVLGDSAPWATVEPPSISLFPGTEDAGRIVFRPPRSAAVPAGPMAFGLHARSREDPGGSTAEEGVVEIAPFAEPFAELVPRTSRGSRSAKHDLAVDNRGNIRLNADLEASDADRSLRFDLRPPGLSIEPGMAGFASIGVKPAKRFWRGQPKTRPFQLVVQSEGAPALTLDGTLLQEALLPPWLGRAVAALVGLIVLAVLAWLFLLKPSIDSAVSEAVASPIAELRDDVNSALDSAGLPTMGPDGGSEPAPGPTPTPEPGTDPTPTPTPGGPVIAGAGSPIDGRLTADSPPFTPDGTLFITDLVFSNPNGRQGLLILQRDGTELMELRLENFRDLDFHFVTPIVVPDGSSLVMNLTCIGAGAGSCDPAVLYSGYLRP
jgi:hypothetical protein